MILISCSLAEGSCSLDQFIRGEASCISQSSSSSIPQYKSQPAIVAETAKKMHLFSFAKISTFLWWKSWAYSVFLSPFFILFYKSLSGRGKVSNCLHTMQSYMEVLQAQQSVCFTCCKEKGARTSCLPLCFQRSKKSKSVASGILK